MRTTKSKKPITIASVCVAAVACAVGAYRFVYLPLRPADVSHARISINATGKFDESQIDGAVKADLARLKSWNGCRVDAPSDMTQSVRPRCLQPNTTSRLPVAVLRFPRPLTNTGWTM